MTKVHTTDLDVAFERLDAYIGQMMESERIPGIAVALTDAEKTLRVSTYGYVNLDAQSAVTANTLFQTGSIGKSFTSIALLQEHEAGRLDLQAPITQYLPWFQVRSGYEPMTIHHVLSHGSGLVSSFDFAPDARPLVWALRESEAAWAPGEKFFYSNDGYKALGLVLTRLAGAPYAEVIRSRILAPLGMDRTAPVIDNDTRAAMGSGYTGFYDDRPYHPSHPRVPAPWFETDTGDGCLASPAEDMAIYLRMLLNRGAGPRGRILSEESFALLTQRVIETDFQPGLWYGYGLFSSDDDGNVIIGHGGGMPGFVSSITADLDAGFGAAVLFNCAGPVSAIATYARRLLRAVREGQELPQPAEIEERTRVENAEDYAGTYTTGRSSFRLRAEDGRLVMEWRGERIVLERRQPDQFYVPQPDFALHLLCFGREEDRVMEASHGSQWYPNERYAGPSTYDYPAEWEAYRGHYRAFTPWLSNFRVFPRKGQLWLAVPGGHEIPLKPAGADRFTMSTAFPGHLRFGPMLDGQAMKATLIGGEYYRVGFP